MRGCRVALHKALARLGLAGWLAVVCATVHAYFPKSPLHVLAYHDVVPNGVDFTDELAVTVDQLSAHFSWLKQQGYAVVRLDDVLAAAAGQRPLPEKSVLLTFDDGLVSAYHYVFPLLRLFNYPAIVAVVGRWIEDEGGASGTNGASPLPRSAYLTATQIREMVQSGLVEIASHSYDLHHGVQAHEAAPLQPAAVTRRWHIDPARRETGEQFFARLAADLQRSSDQIRALTGKPPRAMVWPYGEYSGIALRAAQSVGMAIHFGVASGPALIGGPITQPLNRTLISRHVSVARFAQIFKPGTEVPARFITLELTGLLNVPTAQFEERLDRLVDRAYRSGATHVLLRVPVQEGVEGMIAVLNRVAWQLRTRAGAQVLIRWPALNPRDSSTRSEDVARNLAAFRMVVEYVQLAGVVMDVAHEPTLHQARDTYAPYLSVLRAEQPDDVVVWAPRFRAMGEFDSWLVDRPLDSLGPPDSLDRKDIHAVLLPVSTNNDLDPLVRRVKPLIGSIPVWHEFVTSSEQSKNATWLIRGMGELRRLGHLHFGWGPDDYVRNQPSLEGIVSVFSRRAYLR